jgi:hypothetical protein
VRSSRCQNGVSFQITIKIKVNVDDMIVGMIKAIRTARSAGSSSSSSLSSSSSSSHAATVTKSKRGRPSGEEKEEEEEEERAIEYEGSLPKRRGSHHERDAVGEGKGFPDEVDPSSRQVHH